MSKSDKEAEREDQEPTGFRAYLKNSRELQTSILLVIPLFVLYQLGVLLTGGIRNGVDFVTTFLLYVTGNDLTLYLGINLVVLLMLLGALFVMRRRGKLHPKVFPGVLAESTLYALLFGSIVTFLIQALGLDLLLQIQGALASDSPISQMSVFDKVVLSTGAGLYEEIVFRLVLMGGLFYFATLVGLPRVVAGTIALIASSLVFSAIHHTGSLGEAFAMGPFIFRFVAGMVLAAIFALRGFAVAVYTHAIYDIFVMVLKE